MTRRNVRLRAENGMTLIELLVAMVILSVGIMAVVAGFSSGILAVNRARLASTAGALADAKMEGYRNGAFASLSATGAQSATTPTGPDGRTYWMQATIVWDCAVGTLVIGPPPTCTVSAGQPVNRPVKKVTIVVRDGSSTARVLFTEDATFDSSTG
jgi:prepilin-type N-terminal cleavage/methylation domain-containing protein